MARVEVVVVGGGIIGCASAALLAERGLRVLLVEATEIAAGASGRNSGSIQHPFDPDLLPLHRRSLELYRELETVVPIGLPQTPAGILLLTDDRDDALRRVGELAETFPELEAGILDPDATRSVEPALSDGWWAVRVETGYPTQPDAATRAWAERALRAGAAVRMGSAAGLATHADRVTGVVLGGNEVVEADRVLLAAGPWTPELLPAGTWQPPISRTWGVTVQLRPATMPRHILEEGTVHTINVPGGMRSAGEQPASVFSLMPVAGTATIGSTFLADEPDPAAVAPVLVERGAVFVPALASAEVLGRRLCARPQSADGRPFIGLVPGFVNLGICAGHGPWGISAGPASAELAVGALLDGASVPTVLGADRKVRAA